MSRQVWTAVAVAVLAAGGLWLALSPQTGQVPVATGQDAPQDGDRAQAMGARDPSGTSDRAAIVEGTVEPPVADGIVVEVLHENGLAPVPGADIFYVEPDDLPPGQQGTGTGPLSDRLALARQHGRHFVTGDDGTTSLPRGPGPAITYAEAGVSRGMAALKDAVDGRLRLIIGPVSHIDVQVVNAQGLPEPGVPVALVYRGERRTAPGPIRFTSDDPRPREAPWRSLLIEDSPELDAMVRFDLVPGFTDQSPPESEFAVALWTPLAEPVQKRLDLQDLPEAPIVLKLPTVGAVEIHALDSAGRRVTSAGQVLLSRSGERVAGTAVLRDGVAAFRHVGLGLQLQANLRFASSMRYLSAEGPGPIAAGETAVLVARDAMGLPGLTMRVLDPEGHPLPETTFQISIAHWGEGGGGSSVTGLTSDRDALIQITLPSTPVDGRTLSVWRSRAGEKFDPAASARLDLSQAYPPGNTHLGDVRLEPAPLLVQGRILDPRGNPVAGAGLTVMDMVPRPERPGTSRHSFLHGSGTESSPDGQFEVHGWAEGRLSVQITKAGYIRPKTLECLPGTAGLEVMMERGGSVIATITEDSFDVLHQIEDALVSLADTGQPRIGRFGGRQAKRQGNTLTWSDLPSGPYELVLGLPVGSEPIVRIRGIMVEGGEETRDPRAQDIDLTGMYRSIEVTVLDQDGKPLRASLRQTMGSSWWVSKTDDQGSMVLAVHPGGVDLEVSAPGYLSESRNLVASDQVFHLRPGPVVHVEMNVVPSDLGEDVEVQLLLAPDELSRGGIEMTPDEPTSLPDLGTHTVRWRVRVSGRVRFLPDTDPPQTVDIEDTPETQVLRIAFPEEREAELRQLIRDLREGR